MNWRGIRAGGVNLWRELDGGAELGVAENNYRSWGRGVQPHLSLIETKIARAAEPLSPRSWKGGLKGQGK